MRGITKTLLLLTILLLTTTQAQPAINITKENIQPGETILGTIQENGLTKQLTYQDIEYYQGRKKLFFETDITKHNNTYYFYTYANKEGNYTLQIGPLLYQQEGTLKEITLTKEITIKKEELTQENTTGTKILTIKPGFIKTTQETITLYNTGTLPLEIEYENNELTLNTTQQIQIPIQKDNSLTYLKLETYKTFNIPILPTQETQTTKRPKNLGLLQATPEFIQLTVEQEKETQTTIQIINTANKTINNITLQTQTPGITFNPQKIEQIEANETKTIELIITTEENGTIRKSIETLYDYEEEKGILQIDYEILTVPKGYNPKNITQSPLTCKDEGGIICNNQEFCNGEATYSKDGEYCCLAQCVQVTTEEQKNNTGIIIGTTIIILLGILGYYIYKKQKKTTNKEDPIQKATQTYQQKNMQTPLTKKDIQEKIQKEQNNNKDNRQWLGKGNKQ